MTKIETIEAYKLELDSLNERLEGIIQSSPDIDNKELKEVLTKLIILGRKVLTIEKTVADDLINATQDFKLSSKLSIALDELEQTDKGLKEILTLIER